MATAKTTNPDVSTWTATGRNVRYMVSEGLLFLAVGISPDAFKGVTPTEKGNFTIASTLGNQPIDGTPFKLGLNIYGKPATV